MQSSSFAPIFTSNCTTFVREAKKYFYLRVQNTLATPLNQ